MPQKLGNISATVGPHFDQFIRDQVASGRYASISEVLREALRLMEQREKAGSAAASPAAKQQEDVA